MRILTISPYLPWPLYSGGAVRLHGILRELSRRGHDIVLLAGYDGPPLTDNHPVKMLCRDVHFYRPPSSARQARPVLAALASVLSPLPYTAAKFGGQQVRESIRELLRSNQFDLILACFAFMAHLVPPDLARLTPVVLDECESEGLLWRQYLRQGGRAKQAFALLNLIKLSWFQKDVASRIVALLSASEREATFSRTFLPQRVKSWTVPNGVDADFFAPVAAQSPDNRSIVLCAGFGVYRNAEAAIWFVREVFPRVKKTNPDVEFWIVGSDPPREVRQLADFPRVHVTGTVEDVRPYYARAAVSVVPYRYGEGTKLKVLEAMACGVPVVATTIGCQGIDVVHGEHVLIADSEKDFGDQVISLLRDAKKRAHLADMARRRLEEKYTWRKIVGDLEPKLLALARKSQG